MKSKQVTITLDNHTLELEKIYLAQCEKMKIKPISRSQMSCTAYHQQLKILIIKDEGR